VAEPGVLAHRSEPFVGVAEEVVAEAVAVVSYRYLLTFVAPISFLGAFRTLP
jgi:hypothetical protein